MTWRKFWTLPGLDPSVVEPVASRVLSSLLDASWQRFQEWLFFCLRAQVLSSQTPAQNATEPEPESYITTDGQSASLSWNKAPIWGLRPDLYYSQTVFGFVDMGRSL
jgi:hypothetical protein